MSSKRLKKKQQKKLANINKTAEARVVRGKAFVAQFNAQVRADKQWQESLTIIKKNQKVYKTNQRYIKAQTLHKRDTTRVVYKGGKLNKDIYEDILRNTKDLAERIYIEDKVKDAMENGRPLSIRGLMVKISTDTYSKAERMLANTGWSIEDFSMTYGISPEDLNDGNNWHSIVVHGKRIDYFVSDGKYYKVEFKYEDNIFEEMSPDEIVELGVM